LARTERESEGIENKIGGLNSVFINGKIVNAFAYPKFPVGGASLTFFVDGKTNNRGSVFASESKYPIETRARIFSVFKVGGVQQRLAARVLEAGFEHLRQVQPEAPGAREQPLVDTQVGGLLAPAIGSRGSGHGVFCANECA